MWEDMTVFCFKILRCHVPKHVEKHLLKRHENLSLESVMIPLTRQMRITQRYLLLSKTMKPKSNWKQRRGKGLKQLHVGRLIFCVSVLVHTAVPRSRPEHISYNMISLTVLRPQFRTCPKVSLSAFINHHLPPPAPNCRRVWRDVCIYVTTLIDAPVT